MIRKILAIVFSCMMLASCADFSQLPNPILGTYILDASDLGASQYSLAGIGFRPDGTFLYIEVVPGTSGTVAIEGRYEIVLSGYDFVEASGYLYLKVPEEGYPQGVGNLYLSKGENPFLFDWECDRNNGPVSLTLVKDPRDPSANLELKYNGSSLSSLEKYLRTE